jgi:hypothetical protein
MLDRIRDTLRQMRREHAKITVAAAARRADVSRTFLYQNPAARQLVEEAATAPTTRPSTPHRSSRPGGNGR